LKNFLARLKKETPHRLILFRKAALLSLLTALLIPAIGQVVINEFGASNSFTIDDPDYDESADWIELYNTDAQSVNLKGFYLTDNFGTPDKWQIADDAIIAPGGFLLIWSDGRDNGLHTGFKLSSGGEELALFTPSSGLVDSVTFSTQQADVSYGRVTDGNTEWGYFRDPTPGKTNNTESYQGIVFNLPAFSLRGGFYPGAQSLMLSSEFGGDVRYTTDGSEPLASSALFTAPLDISTTTIVRARIFKPGMIPGPVITNSYFINENSAGGKLPVVSIATEPGNFWDPVTGIYTQDFKPDWEVPVNVELFENNGMDRAAFNQRAGIKINGLYSWQLPQKMLGVYFRKAYGSGSLDYRVTPQRKRDSYKNFALRASGSDWSYTLLRDVVSHHATLHNMKIDIMGFKPAVVFVNGEYLGIHNIREKVDADYIEKSYDMEPETFDLVENADYPEAGDLQAYQVFEGLLSANLSVQANYDAVAALADIDDFTDFVITEMACRNTSIDHNVMAWKPKDGGKWKWVLMDLDRGFFSAPGNFLDFYLSQRQLILSDLFENQGYKEYFAGRLASQLFTTFNTERMVSLIDEHEAIIEDEIPRHIGRWYGRTSSYGNAMPSETYWREQVCNLRSFVEERPASLLADLQNYGFSGITNLALDCYPAGAGEITLDGLKTPGPLTFGPCLTDMEFRVGATAKPGYDFTGWYETPRIGVIPTGSTWKYRDTGVDPGSTWVLPGYDDASWSEGPAELGYGDGDEKTVVGYGGNGSNKYITTWFRKSFDVTESRVRDGVFFLHLLKDDGAIVYLNGQEILRLNLRCGNTDYRTLAGTGLGGETEKIFITCRIDNALLQAGSNLLAVEVHQNAANSSDISFDLGLSCYLRDSSTLYSTDPEIAVTLAGDRFFTARYSSNTGCIIPAILTGDMTLSVECSPYLVQEDVTIPENITLTIDPGVEIWMPEGGNLFVQGVLNANGTPGTPVSFRLNPGYQGGSWGGMVFRNTSTPSSLQYATIEDASEGPDPVLEYAAISAFNADLVMDHLVIGQVYSNPIIARYSDITLTNSSLHSEVTGDAINVKYGHARIEHCRFTGNDRTDADAIDYDEIENGLIRGCTVSGFYGFNSDAVDIGEEARNVLIDSLVVFNVFDKGVSVGQHSYATVKNSLFINCNMGVAVKDSSSARIESCIFYGTGTPVACYEKNIGLAGGNAVVMNSILSNSSAGSYLADGKSNIKIEYSLSDDLTLPEGHSNILGNPLFGGPSFFNFGLSASSPAVASGFSAGGPVDMGTSITPDGFDPAVMISEFFINGSDLDLPQFIVLYNPSGKSLDLSGYAIDKGVTAIIPEGTSIGPGGRVFLTGDAGHSFWDSVYSPVIQWSEGKLSGNGESLQMTESHGIVQDYLVYSDASWPADGFWGYHVFTLIDPALDNHFSENWTTADLSGALASPAIRRTDNFRIYPNPTYGVIYINNPGKAQSQAGSGQTQRQAKLSRPGSTISGPETVPPQVEIFDISGQLLARFPLNPSAETPVDLSAYGAGLYLLRIGMQVEKVVVVE
jgi:hypothetical protein